jgi:DNA-binding NarL/FixJ family response regulator
VARDTTAVARARRAAERGAWAEVHSLLKDQEDELLEPGDLENLADAAWWLSRVDESLEVRRRAYAAFVATGDDRRAGYQAWMIGVEYGDIGQETRSAGWLGKARRHLDGLPECEEQGLLAFSEAQRAEAAGDLAEAGRLARHMIELGHRCDSPDVVAAGRLVEARLLVDAGDVQGGLAFLDELLVDLASGAVSDLLAGWVFCLAVPVCLEVPDLPRATAWNDAAMAWCDTMPAGTPFHGLCRAHHAELLGLGGAWDRAGAEAERACEELLAYQPALAAESFYVSGDLRRRLGDLTGAEEAFRRAHELGRDPQPGLALLRLAQGRADAAAAGLRACLTTGDWPRLERARLLAAEVEVALARDDRDTAVAAASELDRLSETSGAGLLEALAETSHGTVALAAERTAEALERLRRARTRWIELGVPYEAARTRVLLARAGRAAGDDEAAELELRAARATFERLGSLVDLRQVDDLLQRDGAPPSGGLTPRQLEVLRLVAVGLSTREIAAELTISEHTVSRHLENIYLRLGVSSRAAATAFAHTHGLV